MSQQMQSAPLPSFFRLLDRLINLSNHLSKRLIKHLEMNGLMDGFTPYRDYQGIHSPLGAQLKREEFQQAEKSGKRCWFNHCARDDCICQNLTVLWRMCQIEANEFALRTCQKRKRSGQLIYEDLQWMIQSPAN